MKASVAGVCVLQLHLRGCRKALVPVRPVVSLQLQFPGWLAGGFVVCPQKVEEREARLFALSSRWMANVDKASVSRGP